MTQGTGSASGLPPSSHARPVLWHPLQEGTVPSRWVT